MGYNYKRLNLETYEQKPILPPRNKPDKVGREMYSNRQSEQYSSEPVQIQQYSPPVVHDNPLPQATHTYPNYSHSQPNYQYAQQYMYPPQPMFQAAATPPPPSSYVSESESTNKMISDLTMALKENTATIVKIQQQLDDMAAYKYKYIKYRAQIETLGICFLLAIVILILILCIYRK